MHPFVVVFTAVFLYGVCTTQNDTSAVNGPTALNSMRTPSENLLAEESTSASSSSSEINEEPLEKCFDVKFEALLTIRNGTTLQNLTTNSIFECCEACERTGRCTTWRRNRFNGRCELFEAEEARFRQNQFTKYDIGGFVGQILLVEALIDVRIVAEPDPLVARTAVSSSSGCRIVEGATYPNGIVLDRRMVSSSNICCEVCRISSNCNSWYFNKRSRMCIVNRNEPIAIVRRSSRFAGGRIAN
eukprot:g8860.t1